MSTKENEHQGYNRERNMKIPKGAFSSFNILGLKMNELSDSPNSILYIGSLLNTRCTCGGGTSAEDEVYYVPGASRETNLPSHLEKSIYTKGYIPWDEHTVDSSDYSDQNSITSFDIRGLYLRPVGSSRDVGSDEVVAPSKNQKRAKENGKSAMKKATSAGKRRKVNFFFTERLEI